MDAAVGTRAPKQLAGYSKAEDAVVGIPEVTRPSLSQGGCYPQSAKKQPTAGEPWVSALSTNKILAPIPASETNLGFEDVIGTVDGTSKPKALPLSASQAVRNELAKVATTTTQPGQLQPSLGGYVYVLPVTANPEPRTPLAQKPTMMCPGVPGNEMTAQRTSSQIEFNWGNLHEDPKEKPVRGVPRRSKSAGQSPLAPSRRTGATGNSKSCPPARLKSSPAKEVLKHGGKARRDQPMISEASKGDDIALKNRPSGYPLRRAGWIPHDPLNGPYRYALLPILRRRQKEMPLCLTLKASAAVEQVRDAGVKWLSCYPPGQKNVIEQLAVNFLFTMNSTLCFFTVAMRMLSKAPWTDAMISLDVRQAAIVAISGAFSKYPFTRAELALAAGAYQGLLTPTIPMIPLLPCAP